MPAVKNTQLTRFKGLLLSAAFFALPALACEFHVAGGAHWARPGFSPTSGLSQASFQSPVRITTPAMVVSEIGEQVLVNFDLEVAEALRGQDVQISVDADPSITIIQQPNLIDGDFSDRAFAFQTSSKGTYRLSFAVKVAGAEGEKDIVKRTSTYLRVK